MPKLRTLKMKLQNGLFRAQMGWNKVKRGDIAFEYVIILVIMAGVIFVGWNMLGNMVLSKIGEISDVMQNTHAY